MRSSSSALAQWVFWIGSTRRVERVRTERWKRRRSEESGIKSGHCCHVLCSNLMSVLVYLAHSSHSRSPLLTLVPFSRVCRTFFLAYLSWRKLPWLGLYCRGNGLHIDISETGVMAKNTYMTCSRRCESEDTIFVGLCQIWRMEGDTRDTRIHLGPTSRRR